MERIKASKFKEQYLAILDQLPDEGIVITKHGKPVARLVPEARSCADLIGSMKDSIKVTGDIYSTGIAWDAES